MVDSVKDYLNSIAKYPLLTPQQEIQLGRRVARWQELKQSERPLTNDEKRELRSGERARQRFIQSNLQLVVHVARKYQKRAASLELMDLIQEGNIGLARAVELFDPSRGYKFSTYAYWWIRQGITRSLLQHDAMIRLPTGLYEMLYRINRTAQDLSHNLGRQPSIVEIANACEIEPDKVSQILKQSYRVTSLDQKIQDTENGSIFDVVADPSSLQEDYEASQEIVQMQEYMDKYIDHQAQQILKARSLDKPMPWAEMEQRMGISRTRLQNMEQRALNRLRMLMSNPLKDTPLGTNNIQNR